MPMAIHAAAFPDKIATIITKVATTMRSVTKRPGWKPGAGSMTTDTI